MNIYVGGLSSEVAENDLKEAFEAFGKVETVNIIKDKFTGVSRGFGFVEMPNNTEALAALEGLNNKDIKGQVIKVSEARPRSSEGRGGQGGNRGRGGYGRRGGGRDRW